jgi:hypothetical protein
MQHSDAILYLSHVSKGGCYTRRSFISEALNDWKNLLTKSSFSLQHAENLWSRNSCEKSKALTTASQSKIHLKVAAELAFLVCFGCTSSERFLANKVLIHVHNQCQGA